MRPLFRWNFENTGFGCFFILSDLGLSGTESLTDAGDRYIYSWLASEQVAKVGSIHIKGSPIFNIKMSANKNSILSELLKLEVKITTNSDLEEQSYISFISWCWEKIVTASQETPLASFWMPVPNPATSEIYILNADNILQLDLIDATGRKIKRGRMLMNIWISEKSIMEFTCLELSIPMVLLLPNPLHYQVNYFDSLFPSGGQQTARFFIGEA